MSIFDVLGNGNLGSLLETITGQAKAAGRSLKENTPGGLGGLLGAGTVGALLGNVLQGDLMKSVTLAGAGAVAWNFYKKWAQNQQQQKEQAPQPAPGASHHTFGTAAAAPAAALPMDPTAELVMRSMIYAARADGNIDDTEKGRIDAILQNMLPGQDVSGAIKSIREEVIDPAKISNSVKSADQAEDVYRLSCAVIDVDHFMEQSYLQALAQSLGIPETRKREIEKEADDARRQLMASVQA